MVRAFADGVRKPPGTPGFFMEDFAVAVVDESFYPSPSVHGLVLVQHGAQNDNKFVVAQRTLLEN
jgi:hypothetical protein